MEFGKKYTHVDAPKGVWECVGVHKNTAWVVCLKDVHGKPYHLDHFIELKSFVWSSYKEVVELPQTAPIYGAAPKDLGLIDISPKEMMFWLYLPVKLPGQVKFDFPKQVEKFYPILGEVKGDMIKRGEYSKFADSYVYLSAKVMVVNPGNPGNRPGWHSDGFLSDDLNYVWSDCSPTYYHVPDKLFSLTADHLISLDEMSDRANREQHITFPDKHLVRLDQTVVHRVGTPVKTMVRAFAKVSVSKDKYDLVGNSVNHHLAPNWKYHERSEVRNHPAKAGGDTSGK